LSTVGQWTTIDTCGSEIDTVLAVLSVGRDDDSELCGEDPVGGSITLKTEAGTTYRMAVDGYSYDEGAFQLRIRPDTDGPMTQLNLALGPNGHGLGAFPYDTEGTFQFQRNEPGTYVGPSQEAFECALDTAPSPLGQVG
jgi:hypothetical protein